MHGFGEIALFLLALLRALVKRVIMIGEIRQVRFEPDQNFRTGIRREVLPVFRLESIVVGKLLFRVNDQAGEGAGKMDFDHPHVELR